MLSAYYGPVWVAVLFFMKLEQSNISYLKTSWTFEHSIVFFVVFTPGFPLSLSCSYALTHVHTAPIHITVYDGDQERTEAREYHSQGNCGLQAYLCEILVVNSLYTGTWGWFGMILNSNPFCEYALGNPAAEYVRSTYMYNHDNAFH